MFKLTLKQVRVLATVLLCLIAFTWLATHDTARTAGLLVASSLLVESVRPRRHTGGVLYVFTGVTLADIFIPEVYASIQPIDSPETSAFSQAGVAVSNELLVAAANSGTKKVEVPLWNDLDSSSAPNMSDDTDTVAGVVGVDTTSLDARNAYLNKGWGSADLATEMAKATPGSGDPMTRIRNRTGTYWQRQFQYRIIAACKGILAKNVASNAGDMVYDISLQTTVGQTAANKMSAEAIINAVFTMGDQFANLAAIAMHSVPYKTLVLSDLIEFIPDSKGTLSIPTYLGKRVIIDDGLPVVAGTTSGLIYTSVLFGAGSIGYGEGTPNVPVEVHRKPDQGNGGGLEQLWERKTWMIHPMGWNWTETSVAGESATLTELATASNWARIFPRKLCNMAFLKTNG